TQLAGNLVAFNLGIEAGQIVVLLPCLALLSASNRLRPTQKQMMLRATSIAFGMVGCFWLAERLV
ncbi:HupE/UreJ family protein, partial [Acinetobacter baumannii]